MFSEQFSGWKQYLKNHHFNITSSQQLFIRRMPTHKFRTKLSPDQDRV